MAQVSSSIVAAGVAATVAAAAAAEKSNQISVAPKTNWSAEARLPGIAEKTVLTPEVLHAAQILNQLRCGKTNVLAFHRDNHPTVESGPHIKVLQQALVGWAKETKTTLPAHFSVNGKFDQATEKLLDKCERVSGTGFTDRPKVIGPKMFAFLEKYVANDPAIKALPFNEEAAGLREIRKGKVLNSGMTGPEVKALHDLMRRVDPAWKPESENKFTLSTARKVMGILEPGKPVGDASSVAVGPNTVQKLLDKAYEAQLQSKK